MASDASSKNTFSLPPPPSLPRLADSKSLAPIRFNSNRQPPRANAKTFAAEGKREMEFARSNSELMRENKQLQKINVKFQREKEVLREMNAETQKREASHLSEIKRLQSETQRLRSQINSLYGRMHKL